MVWNLRVFPEKGKRDPVIELAKWNNQETRKKWNSLESKYLLSFRDGPKVGSRGYFPGKKVSSKVNVLSSWWKSLLLTHISNLFLLYNFPCAFTLNMCNAAVERALFEIETFLIYQKNFEARGSGRKSNLHNFLPHLLLLLLLRLFPWAWFPLSSPRILVESHLGYSLSW